MLKPTDLVLELASWAVDEERLRAIRSAIFVDELGAATADEFDRDDLGATHFIAKTPDDEIVGTARLSQLGDLSRVGVLRQWRGQQIGRSLVRSAAELAANQGLSAIRLSAPLAVSAFFERCQFERQEQRGEQYLMTRQLTQQPRHQPQSRRRIQPPPAEEPARDFSEFSGRGEYSQALQALLAATANRLLIYTRDLEPGFLDQAPIVEAIADLANNAARPEIKIIVHEPDRAVKNRHMLLPLAQRKVGVIDFRVPSKFDQGYPAAFAVADDTHSIFRELATYPAGELRFHDQIYARPLIELFSRVWDFGLHDPNFRVLPL